MRKINLIGQCFLAVSLLGAVAFANEDQKNVVNSTVTKTSENFRDVGQDSFAELDAQGGLFSGLRLKAMLLSGDSYNIGIEGMYGGSTFANSAIFPTTYGVGVRSEFYLSSGRSHAWMISPGLDGYYVPAHPYTAAPAQDFGSALGQAFAAAFSDVPTRVVLLAPNVDINWLYQFSRHFGFVAGVKVGAAISLNGMSSTGEDLTGKINPDLGLYIGTRF